jgi:cobalt-zinc-cadmium efflux system outer membrane protein
MRTLALTIALLALGFGPGARGDDAVSRAPLPRELPPFVEAASRPRPGDARVKRAGVQDVPGPVPPATLALPGAAAPVSDAPAVSAAGPLEGGESISLQTALYGAITGNPDLVALRNSNLASPEAVEVARHFPTTLNPTLWVDCRPFNYGPGPTGRWQPMDTLIYVSWRQPIELGHQTTHRYAIARAALTQQQWNVVQAELLAMVQTYRFFQTSAYRREKLRVTRELAAFNDRLLASLKRRVEANQVGVAAGDVVLAEVENQATRQLVEAARQDYTIALTDLRNQIGRPESAGAAEPLGEFILPRDIPPIDEQAMIQLALQSRPDIHAARAAADGACAAMKLANADRRPTPVVGPLFERDEANIQYFGFVYVQPIPILNTGKPLLRQREADYRRAQAVVQQAEQRAVTQVRSAVAKWNSANRLAGRTVGLTGQLRAQVERMDRLFEANQTDLTKLLQARQRLIQLRNAELDAIWQATQAQADLLTALGAPTLISALITPPPVPAAAAAPTPAPAPAPDSLTVPSPAPVRR